MTPEEIERTIEFLLQNQAESAVRMDRLEGNQVTLTGAVENLTGVVGTLAGQVEGLTGDVRTLAGQVENLTEQVDTVVLATGDLGAVSRHLVNVQGELIESNGFLRQMLESHAKRLEWLEGERRH